jgi:nitroreductase
VGIVLTSSPANEHVAKSKLGEEMDLLELIKSRCSIRTFIDKPVEEEKIAQILEAGRWAPTSGNKQPWRFIVVRDKKKQAEFDQRFHQPWILNAPVVIVILAAPYDTWEKYDELDMTYIQDVATSTQNILLMTHSLGLGAVWVSSFSRKAVRKALNIPKDYLIQGLVCLGYYDKSAFTDFHGEKVPNQKDRPRRPLNEIAFNGEYGKPWNIPVT